MSSSSSSLPPVPLRGRVALFAIASNVAVVSVLKFGQIVWPEGLPAHSQNALWLASGVNVAGLLLLGLRFWPIILLDAFPAHWLAGEQLQLTLPGAASNALEALLATWMIRRWGADGGNLDRVRSVCLLLLASLVAPLINTLAIPLVFCLRGLLSWHDYPSALENWNLANGTSMLLMTPIVLSVFRSQGTMRGRSLELALLLASAAVIGGLAFGALFSGAGMNLAFVVFPVVIFAAVRFGLREMSAVFAVLLLMLYGALVMFAKAISPAAMASAIWFTQAFCWVLAATGLLVTALMEERRRVERRARDEQSRALEASLREERARLAALRYQVNPHFLFNALNSLRATLPISDTASREMVTNLAEYFRSTLERGEAEMAPLVEEARALRDYLAIEQRRFGENFQCSLEISPDVEAVPVPVFLLQPLVENAIRHGFENSRGLFELRVKAHREGPRVHIEVANTGEWKESGERRGYGLENIRQRLQLLYRGEVLFQSDHRDGWVRFHMELPLHQPLVS